MNKFNRFTIEELMVNKIAKLLYASIKEYLKENKND